MHIDMSAHRGPVSLIFKEKTIEPNYPWACPAIQNESYPAAINLFSWNQREPKLSREEKEARERLNALREEKRRERMKERRLKLIPKVQHEAVIDPTGLLSLYYGRGCVHRQLKKNQEGIAMQMRGVKRLFIEANSEEHILPPPVPPFQSSKYLKV